MTPAAIALSLLALTHVISAPTTEPESLFVHGHLREAAAGFTARLAANPGDQLAARRLALLALWENRLEDAAARLTALVVADSTDDELVGALAETRYRQKRFAEAALLFRRQGRTAMADKVAAIPTPYAVSVPGSGVRLAFAPGAILPVLAVQVNGQDAHFLLDTGAGETILDKDFADKVGAVRFGTDSATYAGGRRASFEHGAVDSVQLGAAIVHGVPVHIQNTRQYAAAAGGISVDGILGTGLLSQFRATLDFEQQVLDLAPRGSSGTGGTPLPFWLLGDHFVTVPAVAMGHIEALMVFDTGLALPGGALVPAASLVAEAGIDLPQGSVSGLGGGGTVTVTPFEFPRLQVGALERSNVVAVAGAFPPTLEHQFGVRIGALLSHGFFAGHRVTLDFEIMQLIVDATN